MVKINGNAHTRHFHNDSRQTKEPLRKKKKNSTRVTEAQVLGTVSDELGRGGYPSQTQPTHYPPFVPLEPLEDNRREECGEQSDVWTIAAAAMASGH